MFVKGVIALRCTQDTLLGGMLWGLRSGLHDMGAFVPGIDSGVAAHEKGEDRMFMN